MHVYANFLLSCWINDVEDFPKVTCHTFLLRLAISDFRLPPLQPFYIPQKQNGNVPLCHTLNPTCVYMPPHHAHPPCTMHTTTPHYTCKHQTHYMPPCHCARVPRTVHNFLLGTCMPLCHASPPIVMHGPHCCYRIDWQTGVKHSRLSATTVSWRIYFY